MSYISTENPQATIWVDEYKTPEHSVFGVYKGDRHWQRFKPTGGSESPFWVEDTSEGQGRGVSTKRRRWLERIRRDRKKHRELLRFPRTQQDDLGKELIQALTEAHAKGESESIQRHLTEL